MWCIFIITKNQKMYSRITHLCLVSHLSSHPSSVMACNELQWFCPGSNSLFCTWHLIPSPLTSILWILVHFPGYPDRFELWSLPWRAADPPVSEPLLHLIRKPDVSSENITQVVLWGWSWSSLGSCGLLFHLQLIPTAPGKHRQRL